MRHLLTLLLILALAFPVKVGAIAFSASNNLTATAGGAILLTSGTNTLRDEYFESQTGFGGLSGKSLAEGSYKETNVAAALMAGNNLTMVSGGDTVLTGSYLGAGNDLVAYTGYTAQSDGTLVKSGTPGSFVAGGAAEHFSSYREEKEHKFGGFDLSFDNGKAFAGVTFEKNRERNDREGDSVAPSVMEAGRDLSVNAADNIIIEGSKAFAGNDLTLDAEGALSILDMAALETTRYLKEKTTIKVGIQVGNAYVDAVLAIVDTVDACKQVAEAAKELARMERLHREGKATAQAVDDARIALAMTTVSAGTAGLNAASSVAAAVPAAGSGLGTGFYASVGMSAETKKTETNTSASESIASEISAGRNIDLNSGAGTHQRGSYVVSDTGDITYRTDGDLFLEAGKSTYSGKTTESTTTADFFVGTNFDFDFKGLSASAGVSKSKDTWGGTTWNNSVASAEQGTVRFDVAGDMRAEGFNALGKHIVADVGGNLDLSSRQNTSHSSGSSFGVNAGFGIGVGEAGKDGVKPNNTKNVSGGVNKGNSHGDRAWADSTSSLVGTESVDLNVDGRLGVSGAVIANIKDDGTDGGNLRIAAGSVSFNDLQNHDEYDERAFGISTGTGFSLPPQTPPSGTTSVSITHKGEETQGVTRATIGQGTITAAGVNTEPEGLNRDLNRLSQTTSSKITGALDATMTVDNRVFTGAGWTSIVEDVAGLPGNLVAAGAGAGKGAVYTLSVFADVLASIGQTFSGTAGLDPTDLPKVVHNKVSFQQVVAELPLTCPSCVDYLNGKNFPPDELEAIQGTFAETARTHGLTVKEFIVIAQANGLYGLHNKNDGGTVVANTLKPDGSGFTSGEERVFTFGHETPGHSDGGGGEEYADFMGNFALEAMDLSNWLNGNQRVAGTAGSADWVAKYGNSDLIRNNNAWVDFLAVQAGTSKREDGYDRHALGQKTYEDLVATDVARDERNKDDWGHVTGPMLAIGHAGEGLYDFGSLVAQWGVSWVTLDQYYPDAAGQLAHTAISIPGNLGDGFAQSLQDFSSSDPHRVFYGATNLFVMFSPYLAGKAGEAGAGGRGAYWDDLAGGAETGARQVINPNSIRAWDLADDAYAGIRTNTSDIATISENIGWLESRVARVKEHIFFKEHQLDSGVRRFDADPGIANAWNRMATSDYVPSDLNLMQHEIFESKFEGIFKTDYRSAHDATIRAGRLWDPE